MMTLMATAGVCTSCSNDNEPQPEESAQNPTIEQMKQVWNEVGQEMQSIDPAPLNQLIAALNDKSTKMTTRTVDEETGAEGEETAADADLVNDLRELLSAILSVEGDEPWLNHSLSFVNAQRTFALLYEFQQIHLCQEDEQPCEGVGTVHALDVTVMPDDTTRYDIVLAHRIEVMDHEDAGDRLWNQYSLTVRKNDAHLLDMATHKALGRFDFNESGEWNKLRIGHISYLEHEVYIFFCYATPGQPDLLVVTYSKNGSELVDVRVELNRNAIAVPYLPGRHSADYTISLKEGLASVYGRVNKISTLVAHAAAIGLTYKNGTTEATCVKLANDFNENVTANIAFAGTDLGDILLGYRPMEGSVNYKPVIEVSSPIFGETPLSLDEILALLGVTWDDIKEMIGSLGEL